MHAVILAAGVGTRLGRPFPKSLSVLPSGERIMGRQIRLLREAGIERVTVVVGFKMHLIMEEYPDVFYSYNPLYYVTNTSKSLLHCLQRLDDDVLWMNGDVVFDPAIVHELLAAATAGDAHAAQHNLVCVDKKRCAEEEVKYRIDPQGNISEISKTVADPQGEAVGINLVSRASLPAFVDALRRCDDMDYFEMGMELCVRDGMAWKPFDISAHRCIEVDFLEDWQMVQSVFPEKN